MACQSPSRGRHAVFPPGNGPGPEQFYHGLLRPVNTLCGVLATPRFMGLLLARLNRLAAVAVAVLAAHGAWAQERPETNPPPPPAEPGLVEPIKPGHPADVKPDENKTLPTKKAASPKNPRPARPAAAPTSPEPPAPAIAMAAYRIVENWIRSGEVPADPVETGIVAAAAVTLRYGGEVVGRGVDTTGDGTTLWRAAREAWREAESRLPVERDALAERNMREVAGQVAITLELSGALVPLDIAEFSEVATLLSPGLEGVAARIGDGTGAVFPGALLASGADPGKALGGLVSKLTDDPQMGVETASKLRTEHGAAFYRFRTAQLAQPRAGVLPVFLLRGGRLHPKTELSTAELRRFASGVASHLAQRRWPGVEKNGFSGTYDPVRGTFDPSIASDTDQALAAFALFRCAGTPGIDAAAAQAAQSAGLAALEALAGRSAELDPVAASLALGAIREYASTPADRARDQAPSFNTLAAACEASLDKIAQSGPDAVAASQRAVIAWGLAVRRSPSAGEWVRRIYRETPPAELVSQMPWLGWAELTLAGPGGAVSSATALRSMRSLLWQHQLAQADLPPDSPDLEGGIVFTASKNPLPTWQAARPIAFAATMVGDPRLTEPGEAARETARLLSSIRFLRQLAADEAAGHMYQSPPKAMWGVRAALWDQSMPLDASALTLLAVCETLSSADALSKRMTANQP